MFVCVFVCVDNFEGSGSRILALSKDMNSVA